jgi:O-acetyl-ADP-ribose deacetylase (regulator of RNase III)
MTQDPLREAQISPEVIFQIVQGDITQQEVDAIVNAANAQLQHGGGVAGVIARAGGPVIQQESNAWVQEHGPVTHDRPAYTSGGDLPCQYVIHAVGPVWGSGNEDQKLSDAVTGSLARAEELGLNSLALPAISTGIFGFPLQRAARVIFDAVRRFAEENSPANLNLVRLVLYGAKTGEAFLNVWDQG